MNISYSAPLSNAWARAKRMLFRPLHPETWFVVGFSVFLARLFGGSGSLFNWNLANPGGHARSPGVAAQHVADRAHDTVLRLMEHPLVLLAFAMGLVAFALVLVVLAWVSARAEFVFLDNVATGRAEFLAPWGRCGRLGRSLFLWRAAFSFAYLPPVLLVVVPFLRSVTHALKGGEFLMPDIVTLVVSCAVALVFLLLLGWVSLLMDGFVVPLMYRYGDNATQAWGRFLPLLQSHAGEFLAFTVFYVVLAIVVGLALVIAGFGTCCIGLVLMGLPYIGSVVLLPIHVTARALGPEFMAQFGPEWHVLPAQPDADEAEAPAQPVL